MPSGPFVLGKAGRRRESDPWHSWSSNGLPARVYISYVAADGEVDKQLVLPQKDPRFYDLFIKTYNVPELATGPVPIRGKALARLIRTPIEKVSRLPITSAAVVERRWRVAETAESTFACGV